MLMLVIGLSLSSPVHQELAKINNVEIVRAVDMDLLFNDLVYEKEIIETNEERYCPTSLRSACSRIALASKKANFLTILYDIKPRPLAAKIQRLLFTMQY